MTISVQPIEAGFGFPPKYYDQPDEALYWIEEKKAHEAQERRQKADEAAERRIEEHQSFWDRNFNHLYRKHQFI